MLILSKCLLIIQFWTYIFLCQYVGQKFSANVPTLAAVAWNSRLNITNIQIRLEWTEFFRRKNQAQAIAANVCWRKAFFLQFSFYFAVIFAFHFSTFYFPLSTFHFLFVNSLNIKKSSFARHTILKQFNFLRLFCYVQSSEDFRRFNFLRKTFHASEFCVIFSETFKKSSFKILLFLAFAFQMLLNFCPLCNFHLR